MSTSHRALHKSVDLLMHEQLRDLLRELMRKGRAKDFSRDLTLYPGYADVIRWPMDLSAVQRHLMADQKVRYADKRYARVADFAADVRHVFKNCFLFNAVEHRVFKDGRDLCDDFDKELAKAEAVAEARGPRCPPWARCQLLLTDLQHNPLSEWFRGDEWRALGPAYLRGVGSGRGIDLDEVQSRVDAGAYGAHGTFDLDAFAVDVCLVWQNALDFNGEASKVGVVAKLLQLSFERRMANVRAAPYPTAGGTGTGGKRRRELAEAFAPLDAKPANRTATLVEQVNPGAVSRGDPDDLGAHVAVDIDALSEEDCARLLALHAATAET